MILQKNPRFENRKLLDLARGMPCQGCGNQDETIVMAHSNFAIHGKAKSMKAHDCFVAALCMRCHSWLDSGTTNYQLLAPTREDKLEFFRRASEATMLYLWRNGRIGVV